MNKPQILVVEDDTAVGNLITTTLETQNYLFHRAKTGAGALMDALSYRPDVILLDLGLPDMDGVTLIQKIRSWSNLPIIVISARSEDSDKVSALDAGADDYLTKPFSVEELPLFGFELSEVTRNLHENGPVGVMTDYEAKFHELGQPINRCVGTMVDWEEPEVPEDAEPAEETVEE